MMITFLSNAFKSDQIFCFVFLYLRLSQSNKKTTKVVKTLKFKNTVFSYHKYRNISQKNLPWL